METKRNPVRKSSTFVTLSRPSNVDPTKMVKQVYRLDGTSDVRIVLFDKFDVPRIPSNRWETNQDIITAAQKRLDACYASAMDGCVAVGGSIGIGR